MTHILAEPEASRREGSSLTLSEAWPHEVATRTRRPDRLVGTVCQAVKPETGAKENAERRGTGGEKVTELETSMDISGRMI